MIQLWLWPSEGGNIIIGINESASKHTRSITGSNHNATQLGDTLHQLVYEYVDPTDLSLDVYVIEDKGKNPKLIGIEIKNKAKRFYAKRYHGRSTRKSTTYTLLLRVNGQTITTDFLTFINYVYGKSFTTDDTLISKHFRDLKDNVVRLALELLESEPDKLPSLDEITSSFSLIDTGLLKDLLENHYPKIKPLWTRMISVIDNRNTIDNRINEIIETAIKNKLDKIKIKYKVGMYDQESIRVNAVPIKEVRERLRKLIENNSLDSEIDHRLSVEHYTTSSTIRFYDIKGQHSDIYSVNQGKNIKESAEKIKNHLKQIFVKVNSRDDVLKYIQQLNNLNRRFEISKLRLHSALRELAFKVELNNQQCKYLAPDLE